MTNTELAQAILDENGAWMVSQMGRDGLDDLIWDLYPAYQKMSETRRVEIRQAVAEELFA